MMKKLDLYNTRRIAFMGLLLIVCSAFLGSRIDRAFSQENNIMEQIDKYSQVMQLVQRYYVDKANIADLNDAAIVGMLGKLDPHSVYMPPKNVKESAESFKGNFEGIGVQFMIGKNDTILVDAVIPGGPSEQVGLIAGDKITHIDGRRTAGFTEDSVKNNLRGSKGTKVTVKVTRYGMNQPIDFTITRDIIPIYSVTAHFMVDEKTGYLNINRFAETTFDEMIKSLRELQGQGMQQLVLDLRGNPGGFLEQAVRIADEFIGGTKTIVSTKGRVSAFDDVDVSRPGDMFEKLPIVVLVDNGSASASEIVSGALQDLDRALIVGQTTFGKGLVQRQFPISQDGSAIRLTISRYYTPLGRSIQKPYEGGKYKAGERAALEESDDEDNFDHAKDITAADTSRPKYKTTSGRTVYGGGGITPDFFVKSDTITMSTRKVFAGSLYYDWVKDYVSSHAPSLKKKYTADSFIKDFQVPESAHTEVLAHAKEKKIEFDVKEIEKDKEQMSTWMKVQIGRQVFDPNVATRISLVNDKQFQKAFSLLGEATKLVLAFK